MCERAPAVCSAYHETTRQESLYCGKIDAVARFGGARLRRAPPNSTLHTTRFAQLQGGELEREFGKVC
jgi:hypothetical protein